MKTRTSRTFVLAAIDELHVCPFDGLNTPDVGLSTLECLHESWSIYFLPCHIPKLEELVTALKVKRDKAGQDGQ